jgi:hypothetical protein
MSAKGEGIHECEALEFLSSFLSICNQIQGICWLGPLGGRGLDVIFSPSSMVMFVIITSSPLFL